jgi:hypothetical protein
MSSQHFVAARWRCTPIATLAGVAPADANAAFINCAARTKLLRTRFPKR